MRPAEHVICLTHKHPMCGLVLVAAPRPESQDQARAQPGTKGLRLTVLARWRRTGRVDVVQVVRRAVGGAGPVGDLRPRHRCARQVARPRAMAVCPSCCGMPLKPSHGGGVCR